MRYSLYIIYDTIDVIIWFKRYGSKVHLILDFIFKKVKNFYSNYVKCELSVRKEVGFKINKKNFDLNSI